MNINDKTALYTFCSSFLLYEFNTLTDGEKQRITELFRDFVKLCLLRRRMVGNRVWN